MAEVKITDLVPQETIDKVKELDREIKTLLDNYTNTAKELAKGLDINVRVVGDLDKLNALLAEKTKEAAATTEKLNDAVARQGQVIANTTNTIARQLMEQERLNKTQREAYNDGTKVKDMLSDVIESYENNARTLAKLDLQIKANKKSQQDLEKQYKSGKMSEDAYIEAQSKLLAVGRDLAVQKSNLQQVMKIEEKMNNESESSYKHLSQQLELLKKTYKELTEVQRETASGKAMEQAIQDLDAHLKDFAADMGEFQRNVGNYAIAGQNGVVATESLLAVLGQEAITMQDVADQTKILEEGKRMLDTTDEHYAETLAAINRQIDENKARLTDVSDIMDRQPATIAEAEAQNKRLKDALKYVELNAAGAQERIAELNAKIEENNTVIGGNVQAQSTLKKDLKELVLEIATLSLEYQHLSEEEQSSAAGIALHDHINELIERAAELKDAIGDTNAAISNAASDTRGIDQLTGALQLAVDGFGLASSAAHILGISDEELTKIQTDLQAAIAASNAIQSIQNSLQAQSALMQGVNLVQTRLRTIAENLHTKAQGKGTVATAALTAAQWAFNAAANANPIGLLVVGITLAIGAVYGLVKAFKAFFDSSKEAEERYLKEKEALEELCDAHDRLIDKMKAKGAMEAELHDQSLRNKQAEKETADELFAKATMLYKQDSDEYKEALEAKRKADEEFAAQKEDSLNYLYKVIHESEEAEKKERLGTYEYKRQLIEAELKQQKELAWTLLYQEKITRQTYENLVASLEKAASQKISVVNEDEAKAKESKKGRSSGSRADAAKKEAEELKKAVEAGEEALLLIISDGLERQRRAEELSYARQLEKLKSQLSKLKESQVEMRTSLHRQIEGLTAEHQRKMDELQMAQNERYNKAQSDLIASHLTIVKKGSGEEFEWKLKELENQYQKELLALVKSEGDKTLTVEQAEQMRLNIILKYEDLRTNLENERAEAEAKIIQDRYSGEQLLRDKSYSDAVNALKLRYTEELAQTNGNSKKRQDVEQKLEEDLYTLNEEYSRKTTEASIKMIEDILDLEELSAEDRLKWEEDLTNAKIELYNRDADAAVKAAEKKADAESKLKQERLEAISYWCDTATQAVGYLGDIGDSLFERRSQKIDEELELVQSCADQEQQRITELVEKKVITQEEGEARKRAAEAKTAKKQEELEKKKAALAYRQAIFQKGVSIANIGISTAEALMRLWVEPGWPAAIPLQVVVGALGALQLATVLATPIPKYAKGTDSHIGGPAIVGDGGRQEVVFFGGNAWLTPDRPTLVDIPAGAAVLPDAGMIETLLTPMLSLPPERAVQSPVVVNNDYSRLEGKLDRLIIMTGRQTATQHRDAMARSYDFFKSLKI